MLENELIRLLIPGPKRHPFSLRALNVTMEDAELKKGHPSVYRGKARQIVKSTLKERTRFANGI